MVFLLQWFLCNIRSPKFYFHFVEDNFLFLIETLASKRFDIKLYLVRFYCQYPRFYSKDGVVCIVCVRNVVCSRISYLESLRIFNFLWLRILAYPKSFDRIDSKINIFSVFILILVNFSIHHSKSFLIFWHSGGGDTIDITKLVFSTIIFLWKHRTVTS